jgi:hypothetical protein
MVRSRNSLRLSRNVDLQFLERQRLRLRSRLGENRIYHKARNPTPENLRLRVSSGSQVRDSNRREEEAVVAPMRRRNHRIRTILPT